MVLRDRTRFVVGSLGLAMALTGLIVFVGQMYRSLETGRMEIVSVRRVLEEPLVRKSVPTALSHSLQRISAAVGADHAVDWLLDEFPLPLFLILVGGATAWRSLGWESSASHKR